MKYLGIPDIEFIVHRLAKILLDKKTEPIAPFSTADMGRLDSALNRPRQTFEADLYPSLESKATVLLYSLVKNHPFENGNKRIGTIALLSFLYANGYWLKHSKGDLYRITIRLAESKNQKEAEKETEEWIRERIFALSSSGLSNREQAELWMDVHIQRPD